MSRDDLKAIRERMEATSAVPLAASTNPLDRRFLNYAKGDIRDLLKLVEELAEELLEDGEIDG